MKIIKCIRLKMERTERGQAMLLIALAFIGLVAFIGLAIDAGILFAHVGHLRRGVDAAALSAANQIRQGWTMEEIDGAAEELVLLNLPASSAADLDVVVETCDTPSTSIPNCGSVPAKRKLARVQATLDVNLAFLPIVGWDHVPITADAISEAASIDLVLVIDNSTSMTYDADCTDGDDDDAWAEAHLLGGSGAPGAPGEIDDCGADQVGGFADDYFRDPDNCNPVGQCQPFEKVRTAAKVLVQKMFQDYDRIALITFNKFAGRIAVPGTEGTVNETPTHEANMHLTIDKTEAETQINNMLVYPNLDPAVCSGWGGGDPRKCMRTNHAAGLMLAGLELETYAREEAVKVVVLLSDGIANAAYVVDTSTFDVPDVTNADNWYCPTEFWEPRADGHEEPYCQDGNPETGYVNPAIAAADCITPGTGIYHCVQDAEDAARAFADWVGCLPAGENDTDNCAQPGLGAVIFTIGLGDGVIDYKPDKSVPSRIIGEELLRYIARVGFNGNPNYTPSSPCWGVATGESCGNYFQGEAADLNGIFEEIANRIFTRLTH
jgi:hypothetical protein